ncbi:hypothetical protein BJ684DRAFT_19953 [Piptocephalis cylindrospora]|uniref:Uncharacterized protein n=1 Tax=Piptocephalis cylindrospora TaxID=1907219 RepID=A0A4P9Y3Q1_9FUNG|nr:hypothetical protein BJ684DRAFT_19953 [Piptocephalis cylindrospora]|eukprot:RKP13566.1 hypothetical protein BJ684DRAFT_19953 [Piptocephalis cylindrospora]
MLPTTLFFSSLPFLLLLSVNALPIQDGQGTGNNNLSPDASSDNFSGTSPGVSDSGLKGGQITEETGNVNRTPASTSTDSGKNTAGAPDMDNLVDREPSTQKASVTLPNKGDYVSLFTEDKSGRYYICQSDHLDTGSNTAYISKFGEPLKRCIHTYDTSNVTNAINDYREAPIFRSGATADVLGIHPKHFMMFMPYNTRIDDAKYMYTWDLQPSTNATSTLPKSAFNGTVQAIEMSRYHAMGDQMMVNLYLPPLDTIPRNEAERVFNATNRPGQWFLETFGTTLPQTRG